MSDSIFKLQLLARSELSLTQIQARRATARSAYFGFALVLFLLGLALFNFAGFQINDIPVLNDKINHFLRVLITACKNKKG